MNVTDYFLSYLFETFLKKMFSSFFFYFSPSSKKKKRKETRPNRVISLYLNKSAENTKSCRFFCYCHYLTCHLQYTVVATHIYVATNRYRLSCTQCTSFFLLSTRVEKTKQTYNSELWVKKSLWLFNYCVSFRFSLKLYVLYMLFF